MSEEATNKNSVWESMAVKAGAISALLAIIGAAYSVGKEAAAREQYDKTTQITAENRNLKNENSKLRDDLNAANSSLVEYKVKVDEKRTELEEAVRERNEAKRKAKETLASSSLVVQRQKVEALIIESMQRYTELGVDMGHWDNCDKEYTKRYMQGKGLLDQIKSLNEKYKISTEYSWFVTKQQPSFVPLDRTCKP